MLETINTIAVVATLVVLTAGAVAAAIQLRHMRTGNQLQAFLDIYGRAQTPELDKLFQAVQNDLPRLTADPNYLTPYAAGTVRFNDSPLLLAFWFDEVGAALRQGLISENIMFQMGGSAHTTVTCWRNMLPVIEAVRTRAPYAFIHFEFTAVRAKQWIDTHPEGDYPRGVPRWRDLT